VHLLAFEPRGEAPHDGVALGAVNIVSTMPIKRLSVPRDWATKASLCSSSSGIVKVALRDVRLKGIVSLPCGRSNLDRALPAATLNSMLEAAEMLSPFPVKANEIWPSPRGIRVKESGFNLRKDATPGRSFRPLPGRRAERRASSRVRATLANNETLFEFGCASSSGLGNPPRTSFEGPTK